MDEYEELKLYDALWVRYRSRHASGEDVAPLCLDMERHCESALARHTGLDPLSYRTSMWMRRLYLHRHGRHGEVWSGTCALAWRRSYDRGVVGRVPLSLEGKAHGFGSGGR